MLASTTPFTRRMNAPADDRSLRLSDFVLFVIFVVSFNCGIWDQ
jgi:hypothetical protein